MTLCGYLTVRLTSCLIVCICFFWVFFVTLVCSFPDVEMDTSAVDAYRPSRCGCTIPILSKVCPFALSSREQRHWIPSVEPCCHSSSSPALLLLSPPLSQVITQWDAHCTAHAMVSSIGTLCFYCLFLSCCSNSMSFSLSPSPLSSFFLLHTLLFTPPLTPLSVSPTDLLTPPPPPPSLFVAFVSPHQVSKWLYWWSLSNLRYGQFLPYVNFLFCHSVQWFLSRVLHVQCGADVVIHY